MFSFAALHIGISVVQWNVNLWQFVSKSLSWGWLQFQFCRPHDIDRQIAMEIPFSNTVKTREKLYPLIGYWGKVKNLFLYKTCEK